MMLRVMILTMTIAMAMSMAMQAWKNPAICWLLKIGTFVLSSTN